MQNRADGAKRKYQMHAAQGEREEGRNLDFLLVTNGAGKREE